MDIKKHIQLTPEPLEAIINNGESIDFRLDEPAWEGVVVGDLIEFWEDFSGWDMEPQLQSRKVIVKVVEIFRAASFSELIDTLPDSFSQLRKKRILLRVCANGGQSNVSSKWVFSDGEWR